MAWIDDSLGVLKGLTKVARAKLRYNQECAKHIISNSSFTELAEDGLKNVQSIARRTYIKPHFEIRKLSENIQETIGRSCVVTEGLRAMTASKICDEITKLRSTTFEIETAYRSDTSSVENNDPSAPRKAVKVQKVNRVNDPISVEISSLTLKEVEEILAKRNQGRNIYLRSSSPPSGTGSSLKSPVIKDIPKKQKTEEKGIGSSTLKEDEKFVKKTMGIFIGDDDYKSSSKSPITSLSEKVPLENAESEHEKEGNPEKDTLNSKPSELSSLAKQRRVPSSRAGRVMSFGGLFAGLGFGTVAELTKGALGLSDSKTVKDAFLNPANAERIVDTLCRVRGAALKLGQMLSIQDSNLVSPQLLAAFERVRQAADYMPDYQVEKVMITELGSDWRSKFASFEDKPFAAASIGQVHRGTLSDGTKVAVKIQYPGVAKSIESDIDNLVGMLKWWDVFPRGFFIDNLVRVAKRELIWEVDYTREAEYATVFTQFIASHNEYRVPKIFKPLSTQSVLTAEYLPGSPLDKCFKFPYNHRKFIAESMLKLLLLELFKFKCMQTDPNWSNFLYDPNSKKLMLIDFGSARFYTDEFINNYKSVIIAAAEANPELVLKISREMKFLTGYETKQMEEAHVNAVMIMGEMFRYDGEFDFGKQDTTKRIAQLVPTMVAHRLCPPPEEIYSIHRKLSGIFLLFNRLNVKMNCKKLYESIVLKEEGLAKP